MVFRDLLLDTLRTLWSHKLRTFLTMFGIAWGIISITLMIAAGEGLRVGQMRQQETFAKDLMIIFNGRTSMQAGGLRAGRQVSWQDSDAPAVAEEATACRYVLPELERENLSTRSLYNNASPLVTGSLPPFAEVRSIRVAEGRFYDWGDNAQGRRVAFLGSNIKKQLFSTRPAVGESIYINNLPYTVIGIMESKDQNSCYDGWDVDKIFIPFSAMLRDFPNKPPLLSTSVDHLLVAPKSLEEHETCKWQVRRALGRIHNFDPRDKEAAPIWDTVEEAKGFQKIMDSMKLFLGAVGITTLLLGGIGQRPGYSEPVLHRGAHRRSVERWSGHGHRLRSLRARRPFPHAGLLCGSLANLEIRRDVIRAVGHHRRVLGALPSSSRRHGGSHRGVAIRAGGLVFSRQLSVFSFSCKTKHHSASRGERGQISAR
jgi:putative ABC transport system permease protein